MGDPIGPIGRVPGFGAKGVGDAVVNDAEGAVEVSSAISVGWSGVFGWMMMPCTFFPSMYWLAMSLPARIVLVCGLASRSSNSAV